ncbi:hypothetical protein B0H17DRAFT_52396 [Mycena rosella]|uniref:Uncharacterized protein n=1 Tax=Mycena rosella TaxID=1033263 RepID=A0AAD7D8J0_MYCRO|nr:hypothetical protein B0H17DRAFT_52396 [Mycena rosella]
MLVGAAITRTTSPSKHRSPLLRRRRPTNHSLNDSVSGIMQHVYTCFLSAAQIGRPPPPPPSTSDQYSALLNSVVESLLQSSPRSRQKQSVDTTINDAESYNGSPTTRRNRDPAQVLFGENSLPSNDPTVSVHPISPLVPPSAASATGPYQPSRNPPTSRLPQTTQERAELEREVQRKAEAAMVALQKQPSGSNLVLAPKASAWGRRRISPSQISTPQLVSASTSIDTIPF